MSRALSTTQQDLDRSFEKAIYDVLLANGYIANRATYAASKSGYDAAMAGIKTSKGFCVELFSSGTPQDKTALGVPRIVITGRGFSQGSVGRDFGDQFELDGETGKFKKYNQGTPLSDYRITIELISNSTPQDRLIESVRQAALPNLSFLPKYDDPEVLYLITYMFTSSVPELTHGLIQKTYTYKVSDVSESELNLVSSNIARIKEIEVLNDTDLTQIAKVVSPPDPWPIVDVHDITLDFIEDDEVTLASFHLEFSNGNEDLSFIGYLSPPQTLSTPLPDFDDCIQIWTGTAEDGDHDNIEDSIAAWVSANGEASEHVGKYVYSIIRFTDGVGGYSTLRWSAPYQIQQL